MATYERPPLHPDLQKQLEIARRYLILFFFLFSDAAKPSALCCFRMGGQKNGPS